MERKQILSMYRQGVSIDTLANLYKGEIDTVRAKEERRMKKIPIREAREDVEKMIYEDYMRNVLGKSIGRNSEAV